MSNLGNQEVLLKEISQLKTRVEAELESTKQQLKETQEKLKRVEGDFTLVTRNLQEVFWISDVEKKKILYISPGYAKIWGRSCESLYQSPLSWLEAIHPEDRERVFQAAKTKQMLGTYNEEYRINKPDGSVRWIRDRAFPIFNEQGQPHIVTGVAEDITDQKISQLALKESEARFAQIVQNLKLVLWLYCYESHSIIYVSPAYEVIWGRSCQEVYVNPRAWVDAVHPEDRERVFEQSFTNRPSDDFEYEYRILRPDGSLRWIASRIYSIRNEKGELHRLAGVARDITESKSTSEALFESEEKYRRLFESGTDSIFIFDAETFQIENANEAAARMLGYTKSELLLLKVPELSTEPESTAANLSKVREKKDDEPIRNLRYLKRKNGEAFPAEISSGKILSRNRLKLLAFVRDITKRKKAEEALFQSEFRYRSLVEASSNKVFHISPEGSGSQEANQWWTDITGQTAKESVGFGWMKMVHPEDRERSREAWMESLKKETMYEIEYRLLTRSKEYRHFHVRVVPVRNPIKGAVDWVGTITDITERKLADQALRESEEKYRQLFANASDAIVIFDAETYKVEDVNESLSNLLQYSKEELLNLKVTDFSAEPAKTLESLSKIKKGHLKHSKIPLRYWRKKTGEILAVEISSGTFISNGRLKLLGAIRDITERKKAEDALQESESRVRALLNAIPDKMLRITKDGILLDYKISKNSPHFKNKEITRGKNLKEFFPKEIYPQFLKNIKTAHSSGTPQVMEYQIEAAKIILNYEARIVSSGLDELVVIIRNMTEHRRLEREILEINEYQRRKIGQDLHDGLGQHLTGIAFLSKVLAQKLNASSNKESEEAQTIVQHVNEAISQTRTLARGLHPIELETNGFYSALQEIKIQTEKLFKIRCHLKYEVPNQIQNQMVATHLYRIVQEAVHNAIKHGKAKNVHINLTAKDNQIILTIKDDGMGLAKKLKQGKGMGLEIMKYRARAIGANFELTNGTPRGAVAQAVFSSHIATLRKNNGKKEHKGDSKGKSLHH
jgi:PAS domain S-box-containing protein